MRAFLSSRSSPYGGGLLGRYQGQQAGVRNLNFTLTCCAYASQRVLRQARKDTVPSFVGFSSSFCLAFPLRRWGSIFMAGTNGTAGGHGVMRNNHYILLLAAPLGTGSLDGAVASVNFFFATAAFRARLFFRGYCPRRCPRLPGFSPCYINPRQLGSLVGGRCGVARLEMKMRMKIRKGPRPESCINQQLMSRFRRAYISVIPRKCPMLEKGILGHSTIQSNLHVNLQVDSAGFPSCSAVPFKEKHAELCFASVMTALSRQKATGCLSLPFTHQYRDWIRRRGHIFAMLSRIRGASYRYHCPCIG